MQDNAALNILKSAMLLEMRGKAFYENVAAQSENPDIKQFFEAMAEEESLHIRMLSDQYQSYKQSGKFKAATYDAASGSVASTVLSAALKEKIQGAGYESAAIQAAADMEERAVKLYTERARNTSDPGEKRLYEWLSDWESGHLKVLLDMDRALTEKIWYDNRFWPF
ncbi:MULTISPECIES: ferritin-like domain-containing protein [Desulfococcus]|jgi:rubrerythrin|uniref:Rubrerythrin n=1 Tax=Desulfococcus multivorans DSM 2059 TaxID=1121405 RepID=S7TC72_DESML|nr:ferritin family protein [Desulfococcus multivorans]AOY59504.1 Rbr5: ruberythrin [Desulfococcus multivorans]AQV01701.1 hypothetical protein B2D07_13645 [Desulfococcus multivorans]EPR34150.1 Rubrerythrin [Desulfococcus multivorans DSM 2059]MDX9819028.1 ferritin family protein [Desulfococcus multivorans]SKA19472.1 Rubrerythrin [Desulfococcus multivorans DSM 2059]